MKILIVDPDPNRQRQLRTILTSLGHKSGEIESMGDSKAAIASLRKKKVDLVFIGMLEGDETVSLLKEIRGGNVAKGTSCIAFHAEVTKETVVAAAEAGASSFLAYPFSVSDVESAMKQAAPKAT